MTRTDRLYGLVEELRAVAPRPRSARWLAERFEVSARTIERDIAALQQRGVPIWAEAGRTGGYCLDAAHTLAPLGFTVDEALTVTIALQMLAASPFGETATSALRKVLAVMEDKRLQDAVELAARVHLLEDDHADVVPGAFATALRSGEVLRIDYLDRNGATTSREVEPMGYVGKDGGWYLIGWCRLRDGIRAFRADRIVTMDRTGERPAPRPLHPEDLQIVQGVLRSVAPPRPGA